jgi:hypothetical protein
MVEVTNELIYQVLQRMQGDLSDVKSDVRELRRRSGALELRVAELGVGLADLANRMDRRDDQMERVMRRLDLIDGADAPTP